jgi:hypothetical protein
VSVLAHVQPTNSGTFPLLGISSRIVGEALPPDARPEEPPVTPGDTDNTATAAVGGNLNQFRDFTLVTNNFAVPSQVYRKLVERDRIDAGRAAGRFVEPWGFAEASAGLVERRTVVVTGRRGTGRRTTATCLLDHVGGLHLAEIEVDDEAPLGRHPVAAKEGYLLDLTGADDATVDQTVAGLDGFRARLAQEESCLALVVPQEHAHRFAGDQVFELTPPAGTEVLMAHLAADGLVDQAEKWLEEPEVRRLLASARVTDAARMADLIRSVSARGGDFAQRRQDVLDAFGNWTDHLRAEFSAHQDVPWRALLISAAVLEHAHQDTVLEASEQFLRATRYDAEPAHPLAGEGLAARLTAVGTEVEGEQVSFGKPNYATSVLDHVWADFPAMRDPLVRWMIAIPAEQRISAGDGDRIARHLIDRGLPGPVLTATMAWAERNSLRPLAERLLSAAAVDTGIGFAVRRAIYDWSCRRDLSIPVCTTAITVCGGDFGRCYPHVALTRLGHFAKRPELTEAVVKALSDLASTSSAHFVQVVKRLACWLEGDGSAPRSLAVTGMLDAAASDPQQRGELLEVLVSATSGRADELGALELAAFRWRQQGAGRDEVYDLVVAKANRADPLIRSAISS